MPGILGLVGQQDIAADRFSHAASTLDFLNRQSPCFFGPDEAKFAVATMPDPPLDSSFHYEDDEIAACFAGDLHNRHDIPWPEIVRGGRNDRFDWTDMAEGHFAVAVYDKRRRRLQLFADHFGCHPIFFSRHGRGLIFSTQLAAFVRLGAGGGFDEQWLHRFLFFGYWPGAHTYLTGVKRLRPGTVLVYDAAGESLEIQTYESRFARITPTLRGREAVQKGLAVFRESVPDMFIHGRRKVQFALSCGLDSRTLYAFLPENIDHAAFTYGMPGCADQEEAAFTAKRLGIPHRQLFFDETYKKGLPAAIHETVWLSGGLAWVNRCMLPDVYRFIADEPGPSPILSSGIALDTLFRGHNNGRGDVHLLLSTGEAQFTDPAYSDLLPDSALPRFKDAVVDCIDQLTKEHGRLSGSEAYLSYTVYTLCPSYFTADLEIGSHFASLRVPGYDRRIVELAYELEYSTIFLSKFLPHERFDEYVLQANLMYSHPGLASIPHQGIPLDVYVNGDRLRYQFHRLLKHGMRNVMRRLRPERHAVPIEDWATWFRTILAEDMRAILRPGCLISDYVRPEVFERYLAENRWTWLARLASVELILQLMNNGWDLAQLHYPGVREPKRD